MTLEQALAHICASGLAMEQAKTELAAAMADGPQSGVEFRAKLIGGDWTDRAVAPPDLVPAEIDWENSRPSQPWQIKKTVNNLYMGGGYDHPMPIEKLLVMRSDISRHWPNSSQEGGAIACVSGAPAEQASSSYSNPTSGCKAESATASRDEQRHGFTDSDFKRGDPLPALKKWAEARFAGGKIPNRDKLLEEHRAAFGYIPGISQEIIRDLKRETTTPEEKRGGRPRRDPKPGGFAG